MYAVVDGGGRVAAREPRIQQATERLVDLVFRDEETKVVASGTDERYIDPTGRYTRVIVAGRHEFGEKQMQHFVQRLRGELVPRANFPDDTAVVVGGAPAQGLDFLDRAYGAFPWLIGALLGSRTSSSCVRFARCCCHSRRFCSTSSPWQRHTACWS